MIPWSLRSKIALIATIVAVIFNFASFVLGFPGINEINVSPILASDILPLQKDIYRVTSPPPFLSSLSARSVYISSEKPDVYPIIRHKVDEQAPLASLTKLMTALVVLDLEPNWAEEVQIKSSDYREGSVPKIFPGEILTREDLWTLALVGSDNTATVSLVNSLGISEEEFIKKMNEKSFSLGLTKTIFVEPTGLSSQNLSTSREVAAIARISLNKVKIAEVLKLSKAEITVSGKKRTVYSTDQHIKTNQINNGDGWTFVTGKTGYINESGYNVVFLAKNASDKEILVAMLGSSSDLARAEEVNRLARWSFENVIIK